MRILQLTTSFPLYPGNIAGIFILELAKSLKKADVDVSVVAPHSPGTKKYEHLEGIEVRRLPYFFPTGRQKLCYGAGMPSNIKESNLAKLQLPLLGLAFLVYAFIHAKKYDVIHAHWNFAGLAAIIAGKLRGVPVVINIHHGKNNEKINKLDKFIIEQADSVVCNSSFNKNQILKYCAPKYCSVISPGVDCSVFIPKKNKDCVGIKNNSHIIFSVGRLIEWKGFDYLLQAITTLKNRFRNFKLYLAGDGPEKHKLAKIAKEHNLEQNVSFLGNVPNNEIVSYFQCADVFVLPSIIDQEGNTEGLGVVLLEAMACGVPCIASNVGGIPDIVHNDYNGFLVEPKDVNAIAEKLELLLTDAGKRKEMGEQARLFVEKEYDWNIKAKQLKDLYTRLTKKD